ncbi:MAG: M48 family metalloprotease [Pseudomonadota bacterium]
MTRLPAILTTQWKSPHREGNHSSRVSVRGVLFAALILCPAFTVTAADWGHIGKQSTNHWQDIPDLKPDIFPDAWLVQSIARVQQDRVMLRTSGGSMLRQVDTSQARVLYAITKGIERVSELEVSLYIMPGDKPNAAAGYREDVPTVFINFAMMDLIGDDGSQWAALIGHEVAHLKLAHSAKRAKRSIPIAIAKAVGTVAAGGDFLATTASGFLVDSIGTRFDRNEEKQADYMGVIWALELGFSPHGAADLHESMSSGGAPVPFLSTHPSNKQRISDLRNMADRLDPNQQGSSETSEE